MTTSAVGEATSSTASGSTPGSSTITVSSGGSPLWKQSTCGRYACRVPDGTLRILVQGLRRVRLERRLMDDPYLVGEFSEMPDELV